MSDEVIRLGDDYVGVFTCNEFNTAEQWPPVDGAQFWAFESAAVSYAFIVAGQHPEPVTAWLRAAHNVQIGDSMLAVPVRGGRAFPHDTDNYLFQLPLSDIVSTNVLSDVLTSDRFLLYLPHADQILLMTSAYDGLQLSRILGQRYAQPATGLVRTTHVAMPASSRRRRAEPYDPLESQIREILGPATQSATDALDNLARTWREVIGSDVPGEISETSEQLRRTAAAIRRNLSVGHDEDMLLEHVDVAVEQLRWVVRRSRHLQDRLTENRPRSNRSGDVRTYEDHAGALMLRAVGTYFRDVAARMNVAVGATIVPLLGEGYRLSALNLNGATRRRLEESTTFVLEFSSSSRTRLGALPVIAHEAAHLLANVNSEAVARVRDVLFQGDEYRQSVSQYLEQYRTDESLDAAWHRMQIASDRWVTELVADIFATVAVGPSYLYAFSRFAIGTIGGARSGGPPRNLADFPPLGLRLRCCLAASRLQSHDMNFSSRFLPDGGPSLPMELVEHLASLVRDPFRAPAAALDTIVADLRAGHLPQARPTEILAALWRAVAAKSGYVNEIGALVAVAKA